VCYFVYTYIWGAGAVVIYRGVCAGGGRNNFFFKCNILPIHIFFFKRFKIQGSKAGLARASALQ